MKKSTKKSAQPSVVAISYQSLLTSLEEKWCRGADFASLLRRPVFRSSGTATAEGESSRGCEG